MFFAEPRSIVYRKVFAEANFRNSLIDIHQARSKLAVVYTRDARKVIFVKCAVMYALVSGMRTSIASGSELAHAQTAATLNEERVAPCSLVTVIAGM